MSIEKSISFEYNFVKILILTVFSLLLTGLTVKASGTISGTVYVDYNMNGIRNTTGTSPNYAVDAGVASVTVTVYAPNGTSKSATTAANGTYSINTAAAPALPAGPYRVEFTTLTSGYFPSAIGTNNATSVRFVGEGGSTGVDLGIIAPKEYCQNTPLMVTNSYIVGVSTFATLVTFPYRYSDELDGNVNGTWTTAPSRDSSLAPTQIGDTNSIGATFGLSWNNLTNRVYAAAYQKRGARYGSLSGESTGAIYQISNPTSASPVQSLFVDLNTVFTATTAGVNPHPTATTADYTADTASINEIGKIGLGGLKLSQDGATLYTVNLADKRLYAIPTSGALNSTTITRYNIPTTGLATGSGNCPAADVRPFALGRNRAGQIYVGAVCSAESTANNAQMNVYVWRFDNPSFTLVASNSLTFARTAGSESATWNYWATTPPTTPQVLNRAAPMLTDIEFDGGDMILGFRDRYGDQIVLPDFYRGYGDIMRACPNGANFNFESNGGCGSITTAGAGTLAGNGGGEWFIDLNGDNREEGALGGLTQVPGFNHVISTFYDPVTFNSAGNRINNFYTAGVQRYSNVNGTLVGAYDVYLDADVGNFGKADGIGDSDVLCDAAPLQIGNRVWNDANANGTQDSNETGIQNTTVQLWADTNSDNTVDTQVGTTTTDAGGNYVFGGAGNTNLSTYGCPMSASTQIVDSTDDAEQNAGNGTVSVTGTDLELTADTATQQLVGVRFPNLSIPQGVTITNAYIEFTPRDDGQTINTGNPTITVRAQNVDNAATFSTTTNDISSRATTGASATWSPADWVSGTPAQTSNLSTVVQAVVNRAGWASGNSMAFVMSGAAANNFRRAWSIDGGGGIKGPRLVVQYTGACRYTVNPNTKYEVRLPAGNFASGQALFGRTPSPANTDADNRDSDGAASSGQVVISLTTGAYGENNHTYDFGFYVAPTAANASINGVVYSGKQGASRVIVTLTGGNLTQPRVTQTNTFGYYYFEDLPVGENYVITVSSKKYFFPNPSLIINLQDNISEVNFEAETSGFLPLLTPKILTKK